MSPTVCTNVNEFFNLGQLSTHKNSFLFNNNTYYGKWHNPQDYNGTTNQVKLLVSIFIYKS